MELPFAAPRAKRPAPIIPSSLPTKRKTGVANPTSVPSNHRSSDSTSDIAPATGGPKDNGAKRKQVQRTNIHTETSDSIGNQVDHTQSSASAAPKGGAEPAFSGPTTRSKGIRHQIIPQELVKIPRGPRRKAGDQAQPQKQQLAKGSGHVDRPASSEETANNKRKRQTANGVATGASGDHVGDDGHHDEPKAKKIKAGTSRK